MHLSYILVNLWCVFFTFLQFDMLLGRLEKDGSRKVRFILSNTVSTRVILENNT